MAEEVGFEPTVPIRHNGFRDRPVRPLRHPSAIDIASFFGSPLKRKPANGHQLVT